MAQTIIDPFDEQQGASTSKSAPKIIDPLDDAGPEAGSSAPITAPEAKKPLATRSVSPRPSAPAQGNSRTFERTLLPGAVPDAIDVMKPEIQRATDIAQAPRIPQPLPTYGLTDVTQAQMAGRRSPLRSARSALEESRQILATTTEIPPQPSLGRRAADYMKQPVKELVGMGENLASQASQIASMTMIPPVVIGNTLGELVTAAVEERAPSFGNISENTQKHLSAFAYQPATESGQRQAEATQRALTAIPGAVDAFDEASGDTFKRNYPNAYAAVQVAGEFAPFIVAGEMLKAPAGPKPKKNLAGQADYDAFMQTYSAATGIHDVSAKFENTVAEYTKAKESGDLIMANMLEQEVVDLHKKHQAYNETLAAFTEKFKQSQPTKTQINQAIKEMRKAMAEGEAPEAPTAETQARDITGQKELTGRADAPAGEKPVDMGIPITEKPTRQLLPAPGEKPTIIDPFDELAAVVQRKRGAIVDPAEAPAAPAPETTTKEVTPLDTKPRKGSDTPPPPAPATAETPIPSAEIAKEPAGLRPAIRFGNDTIVGQQGSTHPEIIDANPDVSDKHEKGFVADDGEFMTHAEAKAWMKDNRPEVYDEWVKVNGEGGKGELHSQDMNKSVEKVDERQLDEGVPAVTIEQAGNSLKASGFSDAEVNAVKEHLKQVDEYGKSLLRKANPNSPKLKEEAVFLKPEIQEAIDTVVKRGDTPTPPTKRTLYRGDSINPDGIGKGTLGDLGQGIYYTDSSVSAEYFTDGTDKSHTRKFEVEIKKPFELDSRALSEDSVFSGIVDGLPEGLDKKNLKRWLKGDLDVKNTYGFLARSTGNTPETFNNFLSSKGYDAVTDQGVRGVSEGDRQYILLNKPEVPTEPVTIRAEEKASSKSIPSSPAAPAYETGKPVTLNFIRNKEKAPDMGERYGQHIEPSGRYISEKPDTYQPIPSWEDGKVTFEKPLVMEWGGGYGDPDNWKRVLSDRYKGKKGKALSTAIAKDGYDAIITLDKKGNTSEIVDLSEFKTTKPLRMDGTPRPEKPARKTQSIHPKAMEKFNMALESKDVQKLKDLLHLENKGLRAEFETRTGVKLGKSVRDTNAVIDGWLENESLKAEVSGMTDKQITQEIADAETEIETIRPKIARAAHRGDMGEVKQLQSVEDHWHKKLEVLRGKVPTGPAPSVAEPDTKTVAKTADTATLEQVFTPEEIKKRIEDGLYYHDEIPGRAKQAAQGSTLETAAQIAKRSLRTVRPEDVADFSGITDDDARKAAAAGVRSAEAEALRDYAEDNNLTIPDFETKLAESGNRGGTENHVYLDSKTGRWFKANFFTYSPTFSDLFDRVMIHNADFPVESLRFEGFTDIGDEFLPVFSQADFAEPDSILTKELERAAADTLEKMGYKRIDGFGRLVSTAKFVNDEGVMIRDINSRNVAMVDGEIAFIDPVIMMDPETKAERIKKALGLDIVDARAAYESARIQPDTPAEVVDEAVKTAKKEGTPLKEQKKYLLENIEDALKDAPSAKAEADHLARMHKETNPGTRKGESHKSSKERVKAALDEIEATQDNMKEKYGFVTIEVPDDGTFKILNMQEALSKFKKQVDTLFPSGPEAKPRPGYGPLPKPQGPRVEGMESGISVKDGDGSIWHTNGQTMVKGKPSVAFKSGMDMNRATTVENMTPQMVKEYASNPDAGEPVSSTLFVSMSGKYASVGDTMAKNADFVATSEQPIKTAADDSAYTKLTDESDTSVTIKQGYYVYVKHHYPNAEPRIQGSLKPVIFVSDGQVVAVVSPMAVDKEFEKSLDKIRQAAPEPKSEETSSPTQAEPPSAPLPTPTKIEDFGEKIGGARKDYAAKLDHAKSLDIATEPFSKTWPEPDYKKLIEQGYETGRVDVLRAIRDEIPDKPRQGYKLKSWVKLVESLRGHAEQMLAGKSPSLLKTLDDMQADNSAAANIRGRAELYKAVGHDVSLKGITLKHNHYGIYKGEKDVYKWQVEQKQRATAFGNMPRELGVGDTKEEAIEAFKAVSGTLEPVAKKKTEFIIYRRREEEVWTIGKKAGKDYVDLEKFPDAKAAREYLGENQQTLEKKLAGLKDIPYERNEANTPRVGEDYRGGVDATPETFQEAFGFRGVEFGNYVGNYDRQMNLNNAFDALHDLAGVLGIPTRAISLNGELGLAFGARGHGGKRAPSSRYEPDKIVINLTKESGAGSLAHEWFHAVDNYFSRMIGRGREYVTENKALNYGKWENMRPEMVKAFIEVKKAINTTGLKARSKSLDSTRTKDYWSTDIEMHARAFENYVISKLAEHEGVNDYLANIKDIGAYSEDLLNGMLADKSVKDMYPYLLKEEGPGVVKAFDDLFKAMQTRPTDKGVQLYDITSVVPLALESLAKLAKAGKEALPHLEKIGRQAFEEGASKYQDFVKSMKAKLGELWTRFKGMMETVWDRVHQILKSERGAVGTDLQRDLVLRHNAYLDKAMDAIKARDEAAALRWIAKADEIEAMMKPAAAAIELPQEAPLEPAGAKVDSGTRRVAEKKVPTPAPYETTTDAGGGDQEEPPEQRTTGIKNAVTEEEREAQGKSPVEVETRRSFGDAFDRGKQLVDSGQVDPRILAASLAEKPRALSAEESVTLIYDRMRLQNDHAVTMGRIEQAMKDGDINSVTESRQRLAKIEDDINVNDLAARRTGYEQGLGLAARKMMIAEDYTLARSLQRLRVATGLPDISDELRAKIEDLTAQLNDALAKSAEYEERISKMEAEKRVRKFQQEVAPKRREARAAAKNELDSDFYSLAGKLRAKLGRLNMNFDPEDIAILVEMARNRVISGVHKASDIIDDIYETFKDIPEIEKRDIRDAISNYGHTYKMSQDEIEVEMREVRRQMRLISALEDAEAAKPPLHSGLQRDPVSDEVRDLQKQVKQAMRESGIDSQSTRTPEQQWKTSLDAVKTRLRNQIHDINQQLQTGKKSPKKLGVVYDAEANALKAERDRLKETLAHIEGKQGLTDEQRVRMAMNAMQKSIEEYSRRIKEHDLKPGKKGAATPDTPALAKLRARRDRLAEQFKQMQKDAKPVADPEQAAIKAYKTRTAKRAADLQEMLNTGNFEKRARKVLKMDPEAMRLKNEVEKLKEKIDNEIYRRKLAARSKPEVALDWLVKWRRAVILSGTTTIGKLTAAATMRQITTPIEDLIGGFLSYLPGFSRISDMAPREGGGLNVRAEAAGFAEWFKKHTWEDFKDVVTTGRSELDRLYGKKRDLPPEAIEFFGRMHGALKNTPKRAEFFRSLQKRTEWAINHGIDVSNPTTQATIAAEAYIDANRAIFMNDNFVVKGYRIMINYFASHGVAGQSLSTGMQMVMPIVKIPTNFVAELTSYVFGGFKGAARVAFSKGIENLTQEEAEYVFRAFKKQGFGMMMLLLGYFAYESIGGYYQQGEKRKAGEPKAGDLGGLPHWMLHTPALEVLQVGATLHRVQDHYTEMNAKHPENDKGSGTGAGIYAGAKGMLEEVPFIEQSVRMGEALKTSESMGKWSAQMAESMVVPPDLRKIAKATDKAGDKPIPREQNTIGQMLQAAIPGMRSELPLDMRRIKKMELDQLAELMENAPSNVADEIKPVLRSKFRRARGLTTQQRERYRELAR